MYYQQSIESLTFRSLKAGTTKLHYSYFTRFGFFCLFVLFLFFFCEEGKKKVILAHHEDRLLKDLCGTHFLEN